MVDVALVQLDLARATLAGAGAGASAARPLSLGLDAVRAAADGGAELVVLPELWRTGPFELESTLGAAEALEGPTATALSELAAELGIWLHGGSILEREATDQVAPGDQGRVFNTSVVFDPDGNLVAHYRKRHLFGFDTGEAALIDAGADIVVVDTPLGATGLATCYDLRFPEHFRALVDAGARAIVVSSGWPEARIGHWQVLARARAIENQVNLLACNATGASGAVPLGGRSAVLGPWGDILDEAGPEATTLFATVDPDAPVRTRAQFPVLRDRRAT